MSNATLTASSWYQGAYSNGSYDGNSLKISTGLLSINNALQAMTWSTPVTVIGWNWDSDLQQWVQSAEKVVTRSVDIQLFNVSNALVRSQGLSNGTTYDMSSYPSAVKAVVTFTINTSDVVNANIHPEPPSAAPTGPTTWYCLAGSINIDYTYIGWSMSSDGYPRSDYAGIEAPDYASPVPAGMWHIQSGKNDGYPFTGIIDGLVKDYSDRPDALWRITEGYNDGYPFNNLLPDIPYVPPIPPEPDEEPVIIVQYDIYCDNQLMHSSVVPAKEWKVIDPVLDLQDSAAGSLEFSLPKFNCMYGKCQMMMSTISVRRNGVEIWEGRPVSFKEDMWLNHAVTCEGELAYLNDIYQPQHQLENQTLDQIITYLLTEYNSRCKEDRKFYLGECELPEMQNDTINLIIPYESTLQALNDICKSYNMHMYLTNEWNNGVKTRKISFFNDGGQLLGNNASQKIEFGRNLVDYAKSYNFSSLVTAVLPLGAKSSKAGAIDKDDDATVDLMTTSIEQGSIDSHGTPTTSDYRIRTGFINITSGADTVNVTVTATNIPSGQTLKVAAELYSGNTDASFLRDYAESNVVWFDVPKIFDVASYGATHMRLVFRFSGTDQAITPENITAGSLDISKTRHGTPYDGNEGRGFIIWPTDGYDSRDNAYYRDHHEHNPDYFHKAGDIVYLLTPGMSGDFNISNDDKPRYFVKSYAITSANAQVFINTKMNYGVGMVVVHNGTNHYYLKKAGSGYSMTTWTDLKFNGWYDGYSGNATMYVGGYDNTSTSGSTGTNQVVYNSKIVESGLEEYVTVEGVSGDNVYVDNRLYVVDLSGNVGERPIDIYGRVERKIDWSDVKDSWTLYQNAITYLRSDQFNGLQIDLTAMDMSMLGFKASQLRVGEKVNVYAPIYGLQTEMPVTAIKIPLNKPEDAVYTVGSKTKQSLTSVNTSTNTELLSLISSKPDMSTVLKTAKKSAAEYLLDTQNGYVTMRYGESGHPEAIIISDNEDYTMSSAGYWIFGKHGIGFIKAGEDEETAYNEATVAMRSDGQIVANYITAGTMVADRIRGGSLAVGYWPDQQGTPQSGYLKVYDSSNHLIGAVDSKGFKQFTSSDWVQIYDGKVIFGEDVDSETGEPDTSSGIFMKGNGAVQYDQTTLPAIELYKGPSGHPDDDTIFGIATGHIYVWDFDENTYASGKTATDIQASNKELHFVNGLLTSVENASGSLASGSFITGDSHPKQVTVYNGLITSIETIENNE